ncbi:hypothetical protein J6590_062785 [Homalodisca vitripennis]|nr:hypothetical protein J6590_062785 [Homalodisca vitripennis]
MDRVETLSSQITRTVRQCSDVAFCGGTPTRLAQSAQRRCRGPPMVCEPYPRNHYTSEHGVISRTSCTTGTVLYI